MHTTRFVLVLLFAAATSLGRPAGATEPLVLQGHTKAVTAVAWVGDAVATASADGTIRRWDPRTGSETASFPKNAVDGFGGPVAAFTADLQIAAVSASDVIALRGVEDRRLLVRIDPFLDRGQKFAFRPRLHAVAFSPDGKQLATAGSTAAAGGGRHALPGGIVIVWDATTGEIIHNSGKLLTAAASVAWSPDGKKYAATTQGGRGQLPVSVEVRVWDAETGEVLGSFNLKEEIKNGELASAGDVVFSPDSKRVAVSVRSESVLVWDLEDGKATQPVKEASMGRLVIFSPDGKRLVTAGYHAARVWDLESGKGLETVYGCNRTTAAAFSPDGKSLATGSEDGLVRIWPMVK